MHFADYWASFCDFLNDFSVLLPQMGNEKTPMN